MNGIDHILSILFHECGVFTYKANMGMNVACTISHMLPDCNNCKDMKEAAIKGHLKCLKFLHKNGCEWGVGVCKNAAENGHLECLKYAHENGCPIDTEKCFKYCKDENIKKYLESIKIKKLKL